MNTHRSKCRSVLYGWRSPDGAAGDLFAEGGMERKLARAKAAGIVSEYDTGRGRLVWFEGCPGAALRALRDEVRAALPAHALPIRREHAAPVKSI